MTTEQTAKNKALIYTILFANGAFILALATFCFASPETVERFANLDSDTTKILAYALTAVGAADIAIALVIFKRRDRK